MNNPIKSKSFIFTAIIMLLATSVLGGLDSLNDKIDSSRLQFVETEKMFASQLEESYRQNARFIAKGIANCILEDVKDKEKTLDTLAYSSFKCGAEHRSGGKTGDFFVFDRVSKKMVYDGSPDCLKGGIHRDFNPFIEKLEARKDFTGEEGECYMHENPNLCLEAMNKLYNIGTTNEHSKIYWKFDKHYEWLESVVIPRDRLGFFGPTGDGISTENNIQLQIVVGTQKDEVYRQYELSNESFKEGKDNFNYIIGKMEIYIYLFSALTMMMSIITVTTIVINNKY